jgi:hypothetical protein
MKQEDWIRIMLDSINDQVTRAAKTAMRMSIFFKRKGEADKAAQLEHISNGLEQIKSEIVGFD